MVSVGIFEYFSSLAAGAIVIFLVVVKFGSEIYARAQADGTGQVSTNATEWLWIAGTDLMLLVFLVTASFGLLIYAVFVRTVRG